MRRRTDNFVKDAEQFDDITINNMQTDINDHGEKKMQFAVCMFDCNDLKAVNDTNGHDKGNVIKLR